jgi:hypothetical protein
MTVTQSYSLSLTYTSLRMYLPQTPPLPVPASAENTPAASSGDTVTLSPEATAPPVVDETPAVALVPPTVAQTPASAPPTVDETPAAPASRAVRRAEVLLDALDADQDGVVTKEEFLDRAMALLRRAGARHHHHPVHDEGAHARAHARDNDRRGHDGHGMRRLERKLERLFDRVDDSGDGNVDQAELTDALTKVTHDRRPYTAETPAPSTPETPAPTAVPQPPPAAAMFCTSVTVVIAVKQYTSVAAMAA